MVVFSRKVFSSVYQSQWKGAHAQQQELVGGLRQQRQIFNGTSDWLFFKVSGNWSPHSTGAFANLPPGQQGRNRYFCLGPRKPRGESFRTCTALSLLAKICIHTYTAYITVCSHSAVALTASQAKGCVLKSNICNSDLPKVLWGLPGLLVIV